MIIFFSFSQNIIDFKTNSEFKAKKFVSIYEKRIDYIVCICDRNLRVL